MLYTPSFCCNCGEKIERVNRSLMTSRRFCETCEIEFKGQELLPKIGAALMLLIGLLGAGSYLKSGEKNIDLKPAQTAPAANARKPPEDQKISSTNSANSAAQVLTANNTFVEPQTLISKPPVKTPNISTKAEPKTSESDDAGNEPIYYCGAATKKGTPCTRRVRGGGRCWQHKGQPSMLPPEKLLIGKG